ncbi:MAG: hypothetical protein ACYTHM_11220, partial [Planctomycetota bacterium]
MDRASDLKQIFRGTNGAGVGASAEVQVGPFRATLGAAVYGELGFVYGRWKNSFAMEPYWDTNSNYGAVFISSEGFQPVIKRRDGEYRTYDLRFMTLPVKEKHNEVWSKHEKSWIRHTDIEVGATL